MNDTRLNLPDLAIWLESAGLEKLQFSVAGREDKSVDIGHHSEVCYPFLFRFICVRILNKEIISRH